MRKKIFLSVGKTIGEITMFYGMMLMFTIYAEAYIDPSVMTYLIQAVAGVVIAVGAAIGIYFRRAKKRINDKLGIDENRYKEVESDNIELK